MSIRELPDKWRDDAVEATEAGLIEEGYCVAMMCATSLENALPVWTRITEDPDTWPPRGPIKVSWIEYGERKVHIYPYDVVGDNDASWWIEHNAKWTNLCDLDFPPE